MARATNVSRRDSLKDRASILMNDYILGCIAGLVPDALRLLSLAKQGKAGNFFQGGSFLASLVIQVGLAALAVYLVQPTGRLVVFGTGFGAPEILTRLAGAVMQNGAGGGATRSEGGFIASLARLWGT